MRWRFKPLGKSRVRRFTYCVADTKGAEFNPLTTEEGKELADDIGRY